MKLLLTVILTLLGLIQSYGQIYEQCLTISGYSENVYDGVNSQNNSTILANSSKELVAIGNNKLYRVSKDGVKLWEKTITTSFKDFSIDKDGGAYTIDNDNIFTKYNSNGTLAWQKSITNVSFSRVVVDVANNVHVLGFNYSLSQLFVIKYLPNGTESWSKLVSNLSNRAMTVSSTGEVYVLGYNFNTGGYQLIKYSSTGSLLWSKVIGYDFGYEQLGVGQDGNLYAFLSDDYSTRVIKFNSANGDNLGEVLIDLGRPVFKQGVDNSFFLVGTSPAGIFAIHKVNLNLVATLFNDTGQFFYERSDYKTIDVESDGTVVANIIFANDDGNKSGYFLRLNPAGVILNSIVFKPATTGLIIDYQGNYLLPTENDCLKKIIHCEKINFSITSQPVNFQGCSGIDAQFSFSVTGIGLSYQWKKGSVLLSDNTKYSGVKTSSLTIKSANATDDPGQYSCDILDGCGRQLTSNSVTLSFISASAITSQPANAGQCAGTEAIFQITTSGGQNVKYQWRKGNVALVEGANVVGSKTNTLTLKTITSAEAGEYYCDVTSDCFTAPLVSQKGVLTVLQPSAILTNPQSASTCVGNTTVFSVMATGANLTYQWKKGGVNLTEGTLTTGTKTNSLTIKDIKSSDAGDYTCTVTGSCGSAVTSAMANLTVNAGSQINTQPVGKTVCAGTQTSFSITASGSSLVYSWKKGNTTLANGGKYSGVNTATLNITSVSATEEGPYTCTITNPCGNDLVSDVAQLSITTTPSITARSADLTLCEDQIALMTVTVTGSGVTYQWKKDGVALTDVNGVTGSKLAELVIAKTKLTDGGNYTCEVASGCGAVVTSAIIKLAVQKDVSITGQPVARKICLGDKTTFSVAVNGAVTSYQWKKNGINITNSSLISGATSASLTITQTSLASQGIYSCEIKTICGNVIVSSGAKLETNPRPDLELLNVNCESFVPEWSSLVIDNNNVFGEYTLYEEGSTTSIPDLLSISGTGVYLIVKSNGVCSDTVEWNNTCIITSVEDALSEISVSPNPSSGIFMIRHPSSVEKIKIYDLKGADVLLLQTANKHETYIDMTQQSAGVYYMALYLHDRIVFQRLIIQR